VSNERWKGTPKNPDDDIGLEPGVRPVDVKHMTGDHWERPESTEKMLNVFDVVRNSMLRDVLEQITRTPHPVISIDNEDEERIMEISWESQVIPSLSWSPTYGVIGQGILIHERIWTDVAGPNETPQDNSILMPIGMIQVGGIILTEQEFTHTPQRLLRHSRWSKTAAGYVVTLHIKHFLSERAIETFLTQDQLVTVPPGAVWKPVFEDRWIEAVTNMRELLEAGHGEGKQGSDTGSSRS